MLDYDESRLTPPNTVSTARADNYHRVDVTSPSSIQLAIGRDLEGLLRKPRLLIELTVLWPLATGFRLGPVVASRL